jgi:hypothetical protein
MPAIGRSTDPGWRESDVGRCSSGLMPGITNGSSQPAVINEFIYIEVSVRDNNPAKLNFATTAIIVGHTLYDLLIGMPTIQANNLLPVLQAHLTALPQLCTICTASFANTTVNAYAFSTECTECTTPHHRNIRR